MSKSHVEVTNPAAPLLIKGGLLAERPVETEADLIAAAADGGLVWGREMVQLIPQHHDGRCRLCSPLPANVLEVQQEREIIREASMLEYDVEWDPTITF